MRRPLAILIALLSVVGFGLLFSPVASAAPTIETVVTANDYTSVTVTFSDSVTRTGGGAVEWTDVTATDAGATFLSLIHVDNMLTFEFDGPIQPATAVLGFDNTNASGLTTRVPLAPTDWDNVQASLRGISLPTGASLSPNENETLEVPIATAWMADDHTLTEMLPDDMPSSLDLPQQITVTRNSTPDVTFDVAFEASTALTTVLSAAVVDVDGTADDPSAGYGVSLGGPSAPPIELLVGIGGTVTLDSSGAPTSGLMSLEVNGSDSLALDGTIGFVTATVQVIMTLATSFSFVPLVPSPPTTTTIDAEVTLDAVTIEGLSASPIVVSGPLVTFDWESLPTITDGVRADTVVATDAGWTSAGLRRLTNIGIDSLLFAPSGLATWLSTAQTDGLLATELPVVGTTLGETVGIAEALAMAQDQIAAAVSVAGGLYALVDPPTPTAQSICTDLEPLRVRAAQVQAAIIAFETPEPTVEQVDGMLVEESAIIATFQQICSQLFGSLTLDLSAGTIEAELSVPEAEFNFFEGGSPQLDLGFDAAELGGLSVGVAEGTWSGTSSPTVGLTLGIKLDSDADLFGVHGLVVDLDDDDDGTPPDEDDVTAVHRIYLPADAPIAGSSVTITGTGISGEAQIGFLDLSLNGNVLLNPTVALSLDDSGTGMSDGKVDLAELLFAAERDEFGDSNIGSVLEVGLVGDDVDTHFVLSNSLIGTTANLDVVGDLSGLLPGGTVEFRTTEIAGPDDVDPDTLAIGQNFGDALEVSNITADEVVVMVAGLLGLLAANAVEDAGDERIPVIDVSLNEVAGFTAALDDVAERVRNRVPTSVSELELIVNDALATNGMGRATVGFASVGPSGDPELTLTVDASLETAASFPVSFDIEDGEGPLRIAPIDGGALLEARVVVDFEPVLGIRFNDAIPVGERIIVRNVEARFDFFVGGSVDGGVRFGPLEATVDGDVSIGDTDLTTGGFTASLTRTSDGSLTVPLSAFPSDVSVNVSGSVPVGATLALAVPLLSDDPVGSVAVSGSVPGVVVFEPDLIDVRTLMLELRPNLGTLVEGAVQTARFVARGADEVAEMNESVPVVGSDVTAQFADLSDLLNDVADEIEATVALLESDQGDAAVLLEDELNALLADCGPCEADVYWTGEGDPEDLSILNASGIEVLLTLADLATTTVATTASLGLEPIIEVDLDVSDASVAIGYTASIGLGLDVVDGFYLFPGIDNGVPDDEIDTLVELYASLGLNGEVVITLAGLSAKAVADVSVAGPLNGGEAAGLRIDMPERLPFSEIVNRSRSMSDTLFPALNADINADLPVVLEIGGDSLGVGLEFPFVFAWSFADTLNPDINEASFAIVDASLDISTLTDVIADTVAEFDEFNPLSLPEVKSALGTEIPLIEQTVRETLSGVCALAGDQDPRCIVFDFLSQTSTLATDLGSDSFTGQLAIGSFQIFPAPPEGESRYTAPVLVASLTGGVSSAGSPTEAANKLKATLEDLTGGYMSMPILSDYPAIMGIVLGGELSDEVDIIRFEIPADAPIIIGPSINFKRTLFDLNAGFLEGDLKVALNGGIGLIISGGFGYSTRGIQTGNVFDGIFLIDGDANEIGLGASINASVDGRIAVAFGVASVRFKGSGGFSANAGLDLFDESPVLVGRGGGDGKLYFDEIAIIADAYENPGGLPSELCMFQLRTTGTWHLSFSGKAKVLGITVFNESYSDGGTLWDETITCQLRTRIARLEDRQLILLGGPNADDRFDNLGDIAEGFDVVRNGANVRVNWTGAGDKPSLTFPVSSFDTIVADLGLDDDQVEVDNAITQPVMGRGGPGNDTLLGGGGDDDLDGGDGNDEIGGQGGNDSVRGSDGDDSITGGDDDDELDGGDGDDSYEFSDGFGTDEVIDLAGFNTLDFTEVNSNLEGDTAFGDSTIEASDGSLVAYFASDIDQVLGGTGDDTFLFKDREPTGFRFDGQEGSDDVTFESGRRDRQVTVTDSGTSGTDTVLILGTAGVDTFLLRAGSTELGQVATNGFVARLAGGLADRYDYDDTIENLDVDGGLSGDVFALDDNAAPTHIIGDQGNDVVQVGQIFGLADCEPNGSADNTCPDGDDTDSVRGGAVGVSDGSDNFINTVITRGHLSNGVTHPLIIDGDDGADTITVFANKAPVTANGGDGNDQFVARAFIIAASVQLNGDGGIDDFTYVVNDLLSIDGGAGVDTYTIVGTEADDGFLIDVDGEGKPTVVVCKIGDDGLPDPEGNCAINSVVESVEVISALGIEGDDVFWVRGSVATSVIILNGGEHSDRFVIGDGTLAAINGPIVIAGDDSGAVPAIADPWVLPGEDTTPAFPPSATGGSDRGDSLEVDATEETAALTGELTVSTVVGFGMPSGPFTIGAGEDLEFIVPNILPYTDLEFATVGLGSGDDSVTVSSTHAGNGTCDSDGCPLSLLTGAGVDTVDVQSISGDTLVDLGADDDTVTVGQPDTDGDLLDQIDAGLTVVGGDGEDHLDLDNTAASFTRIDVDPGLVTEAGLTDAGVSHVAVELVDLRLGGLPDVVNVRGTAVDATTGTHIHGNDGNERIYVSSAADFGIGTGTDFLGGDLDDVDGPLFIHGGSGALNLLMISDREASSGDAAVTYDGVVLTGLAPSTITHDVADAFGSGITIWSSELEDVISVTGADSSTAEGRSTLTSLNTGDGGDTVTVDLADGVDGAFVLNTEEGDDTVSAGTSTLGLTVFGGLGMDDLTTGSGNDVVLGDVGTVTTEDGGSVFGGGGPGDGTDGRMQPLDVVTSDTTDGDADTISSGEGEDVVVAGTGADSVDAGDGDDVVLGGHGTRDPRRASQITRTLDEGVAGIDTGDVLLFGGDGNDLMFGQHGGDAMDGGAGDDVLVGGHSAAAGLDDGDTISGGEGKDLIAGDNAEVDDGPGTPPTMLLDVVIATSTVMAMVASGGDDIVFGGPGNDEIYGQQGNDELHGDAGDDIIEGNAGADTISGGDGQDDLIGGGSALDGVLDSDRSWTVAGVGLADENDTVDGDGDADVLLGDNGWIRRIFLGGAPATLADLFGTQNPDYDGMVVREALVSDVIDPEGSFGADLLRGGDGHDELYGQLDTTRTSLGGNLIEGDELYGGAGEDVLLGDLGEVRTVLEDGSAESTITDAGPLLNTTMRTSGTLTREVTLFLQQDGDHVDEADGSDSSQFGAEGDDLLLGGDGNDVIHGGSGDDVANGNDGDDVVFGGDGNDATWGGPGNDELLGGHDEDALDVRPRDFSTTVKGVALGPDPAIWFEAAPSADALTGLDLAYGGWNTDELQADVVRNSPKSPADRLIDWNGDYNRYLACSGGRGGATIVRVASPSMRAFFIDLMIGRGGLAASGARELGLVLTEDSKYNSGTVGGINHVECSSPAASGGRR